MSSILESTDRDPVKRSANRLKINMTEKILIMFKVN